jgi:ABC-type nickel/cobalt efflux system permease component RcnA
MLILGLLLVLSSAAAVVLLLAYNAGGPEQTIVLFGREIADATPADTFVAGIVLALVFCLGLWMVVATGRQRRLARSKYLAEHRKAEAVAAERDQLAEQLAREREAAAPMHDRTTATSGTPGPNTTVSGAAAPDRDITTRHAAADQPTSTNRGR